MRRWINKLALKLGVQGGPSPACVCHDNRDTRLPRRGQLQQGEQQRQQLVAIISTLRQEFLALRAALGEMPQDQQDQLQQHALMGGGC